MVILLPIFGFLGWFKLRYSEWNSRTSLVFKTIHRYLAITMVVQAQIQLLLGYKTFGPDPNEYLFERMDVWILLFFGSLIFIEVIFQIWKG
mmetsp:Transcript_17749/g.12687  ORF Transcript_17749/g.12687 Transcript_17749/m.12687 type:complete len:91 (-) Transcript_17749:336-608(-)